MGIVGTGERYDEDAFVAMHVDNEDSGKRAARLKERTTSPIGLEATIWLAATNQVRGFIVCCEACPC